ncbi:MAG: beta-lactamase family protein [Lentimicrobium sp.]|nr:beta-lactamase family protein [Lentimicrobium sp.]
MKKITATFFLAILVFFYADSAFAQVKSFEPKMDSLFSLLNLNSKFMGSAAIMEKGKLVYSTAVGFADVEANKPATTSTIYRIGSVSKTVTSAMIYQLFEENKLTADTKLAVFFPELQNSEIITINDMLMHRSGLWSVTDDSLYMQWSINPKSRNELIEMISNHPPLFQPGEKSQYSNSNYILLGFILEDVTRKNYSENLKDRITQRTNLNHTYYGSKIKISDNECYSYIWSGSGWIKENETDMSVPHGAGALVSTSEDLVKFIHALFKGEIISTTSLADMIKTEGAYGKGIFPTPFYDLQGFGHTGGIDGFRSVLVYFPEKELSVAMTSNGMNYNQNDILIGVLSIYLDRPYELPDFSTASVSADMLKSYEGTYSSTGFPLKLTVKLEGNILTAQATGQSAFPLEPVSETEFRFDAAGIRIIFPEAGKLNLKQGGLDLIMSRE